MRQRRKSPNPEYIGHSVKSYAGHDRQNERPSHWPIERGLVIRSVHGDAVLAPKLIAAGERTEPFDLVVFSNKAYHLAGAIADAKPYVGETTMILPLLNGMAHMDVLRESFGDDKVLGGFVSSKRR